jgi:hypothetical protein
MVTFGRKAAERNPASTAALRWIATGLSQRRALRHPAGALKRSAKSATSSAGEMKKRIREEVMNGTFAQKERVASRQAIAVRVAGAILAGVLSFGASAEMAAAAAERRVDVSREVDRVKIENLQRWVSAGHEEWCKDARLVAMDEMRRVGPFAGEAADLEALALDTEAETAQQAVFTWTSPDGRATYRVKVERFGWLLPIAGEADSIVWVPTHAEILRHQ